MQGYKYFVEPGRVCFINYGEDYGKMVVIADIADSARVLVEGPDFARVVYPLKRLSLTRMKIPLERGSRTGTLKKAMTAAGLEKKWKETAFAKKLARQQTRTNLTDYERFQVMVLKKKRANGIKKAKK